MTAFSRFAYVTSADVIWKTTNKLAAIVTLVRCPNFHPSYLFGDQEWPYLKPLIWSVRDQIKQWSSVDFQTTMCEFFFETSMCVLPELLSTYQMQCFACPTVTTWLIKPWNRSQYLVLIILYTCSNDMRNQVNKLKDSFFASVRQWWLPLFSCTASL